MLLKLVNLLSLAIALSSLRALGSPASNIQGRDSLENRWNVIYQQVGKNGVQQLCQAILPHATITKTAIITSATPITATATSYTTEVAFDYTTITEVEEATITETIYTTSTTTLAPARRDLSDAIKKLFKLLFADANAWTIAKCRTLTNPLTDTITRTSTTLTPSIAGTITSVSATTTTVTEIAVELETSVHTTQTTATSLVTVVPEPQPTAPICDNTQLPPLKIARLPNVELYGYELLTGNYDRFAADENLCIFECLSSQG